MASRPATPTKDEGGWGSMTTAQSSTKRRCHCVGRGRYSTTARITDASFPGRDTSRDGPCHGCSFVSVAAQPGFVHHRPCLDGTLYTGLLEAGGFVHWRPYLDGTLYTDQGRQRTNPLRNKPPSVQSPRCRFRAPYKPPPKQALPARKAPPSASGHRAPPKDPAQRP